MFKVAAPSEILFMIWMRKKLDSLMAFDINFQFHNQQLLDIQGFMVFIHFMPMSIEHNVPE